MSQIPTILQVPAAEVRQRVAQLALAERLRAWQSDGEAPAADIAIVLAVSDGRMTLETADQRIVACLDVPAGACRAVRYRLDGRRLVEALREIPAEHPMLRLALLADDCLLLPLDDPPARPAARAEADEWRLLPHDASAPGTAAYADAARELLMAGDTLPLAVAWAVRAASLSPAERATDTALIGVLQSVAERQQSRVFEMWQAQLPRWVGAAAEALGGMEPDLRNRATVASAARLSAGSDAVTQADLDAVAAFALAAHATEGPNRRPGEVLAARVPAALIAGELCGRITVPELLPSEAERVGAATNDGLVRLAAGLVRRHGTTRVWDRIISWVPVIGAPEQADLEALAAGAAREFDPSYARTLAEYPLTVRAAVLACASRTAGTAVDRLGPDDRAVVDALVRRAPRLGGMMSEERLTRIAASVGETLWRNQGTYFAQAEAKRRAKQRQRSVAPADYVPGSLDDTGIAAGRGIRLAAGVATAVPPRVQATGDEVVRGTVTLPAPKIGLYAAEQGAPVLLHLPTGAALVPAAGHLAVVHPEVVSVTSLAQATAEQFVPLGGDDVVLAAAVRGAAGAKTPFRRSAMGVTLDLAPGMSLHVSDAAIARARPLIGLALEQLAGRPVAPAASRLAPTVVERLDAAMTEVRARRRRRHADDLADGLPRERVRMTIERNAASGFVAVVGGAPTHGYAEHEIAGHAPGFADTPATPTRATDVDPDALAPALRLALLPYDGAPVTVVIGEDRGAVVVRSPTVTATVPPMRAVPAGPLVPPTASRAQAALLARLP